MKQFVIIHIGDTDNRKSLAARELFPDLPNGKYKIEISSAKQRSLPQNRYYFGLVLPMVRDGIKRLGTVLTIEETHDFLKKEFNYSEIVNTATGECKTIPLSTTKLTTTGFMEYLAKIQQFAAEFLNVVIPDPNQQLDFDYSIALAEYEQDLNATIVRNE